MFAVWLPILPWDAAPPVSRALGKIPDGRVQQYWDPERLVAKQLAADARPPQPTQECCLQGDTLWDVAAVYPKGARWTDRMPTAVVFNGPVADITDAVSAELRR